VQKEYRAVVRGRPPRDSDTIHTNIARDKKHRLRFTVTATRGKTATTSYRLLAAGTRYSYLDLFPHTGRTHQLRVHMKHLGCPILGDPLYGRSDAGFPNIRLMLHAHRLHIRLPGDTQPRCFEAPVPPDMAEVCASFGPTSFRPPSLRPPGPEPE
jgi:23S rRNA pseudouridine1911/1915/1917 synthase